MRKDEFPIVDKFVQKSINEVLDNISAEIEKEIVPKNSNQYDYETKWQNLGLRMALKVIDKYKAKEDKMIEKEAIKIFQDKIKTMEHGAICCNYGNDKDAFLLALKLLKQEPCEDCIRRQAVLDLVNADWKYEGLEEPINSLPPVTPQPKTGHWIKEKTLHGWDGKSYQCSECGRSIHLDLEVEELNDYPYCHCGAKMSEGSEKE